MNSYSEKFEKMRIAGKLAAQTLDMLTENIKDGISTAQIDKLGYEFILLDEPTSSLDVETTRKILDILEKLDDKTVILISHQKNNLSICNKVYDMKNGKLTLDEKNKN